MVSYFCLCVFYQDSLTFQRINVKLGGINSIPEPSSVSFLTDPRNPTIVLGEWLKTINLLMLKSMLGADVDPSAHWL
jgi:hypothetical protein